MIANRQRSLGARARAPGYLLALVPPLLPPLGWLAGAASGLAAPSAWLTPLIVFGLVPVIEPLIGETHENPGPDEAQALDADARLRWLPLAVLPLQAASLLFCGWAFLTAASHAASAGYLVSCGLVSVATAMVAGHELIHRRTRWEQAAGAALLSSVWYATYKPEHLWGHHIKVGTPEDNATAARGENVYGFIGRAMRRNPRDGYRLQAARMRRRGLGPWSWRNDMVWWTALSLSLTALAFASGGVRGLLFFGGQAVVAVFLLELINYVEHYGLMRERLPNGRWSRVTPAHSWSSQHLLTNWIVFQLARHGDHHVAASRAYPSLRALPDSPRLPFGYPTALMLAAVPPLWRRVMDPRLAAGSTPA